MLLHIPTRDHSIGFPSRKASVTGERFGKLSHIPISSSQDLRCALGGSKYVNSVLISGTVNLINLVSRGNTQFGRD